MLAARRMMAQASFGLTAPVVVGLTDGYGDPSFAPVSVTPLSGSGLLVAVQHIGYGWGSIYGNLSSDPWPSGGVTLTDSWGLTWTKVAEVHVGENVGKDALDIVAFVAPQPGSLAAGTVTFNATIDNGSSGENSGGYTQRILQVDGATYTGTSGTNTRGSSGSATPLTVTLSSAPSSGDGVLTFTSQYTPNVTPTLPTDFTSSYLDDSGQPYGQHDWHQGAYNITDPSQTQDWGFTDDNFPIIVAGLSLLVAPA